MTERQNERGAEKLGAGPSVLISGASFAGLAAAFWMHRLGYVVTVVEVAKDLKKGGTPVDIREGVIDVVKRMGLSERIAARSLNRRPMEFLSGDGEPYAVKATKGSFDGSVVEEYEIERDVLLDLLFDEVRADVEFRFGDSIAEMEETADEVAVSFASGQRRVFSLVMGCDGTHSAVRRMCFGEESSFLVFLQCYFSLTIVDKLLIEEDTAQMFNVPGKAVMLSAYNGKTDIGFCFFSEEKIVYDRRDREQQRRMILDAFAGEGWRVREFLKEMVGCDNFYFDQLCQIRMKSWTKGRVALVGDAGYCPSPAAGMGGSMAILGAAALADALQRYPDDLGRAFAEYDRSFRPTVEAIQTEAIEVGLEMFLPKSEEAIARRNLWLNGN